MMKWFSARGYRTTAVDLPPFGFSEKPADGSYGNSAQATRSVSLLDQLEVDRVTLFGHSFGSGATLETALRIPGRVVALILEDVGGLHLTERTGDAARYGGSGPGDSRYSTQSNTAEFNGAEWLLRTPTLRDPLLALVATNPLLTRRLLESMVFDARVVSDEHVAILQAPLALRGGTHAFGDWLHEALFPTQRSLTSERRSYAALTMATLVLWGEQDSIIPLAAGSEVASLLPNAQLRTLPNTSPTSRPLPP